MECEISASACVTSHFQRHVTTKVVMACGVFSLNSGVWSLGGVGNVKSQLHPFVLTVPCLDSVTESVCPSVNSRVCDHWAKLGL